METDFGLINPHSSWLVLARSHNLELGDYIENKRSLPPPLFQSDHSSLDNSIIEAFNHLLDNVCKNVRSEFESTPPEDFSKIINPLPETYELTYQNPVCRYMIETGIRDLIVTLQKSQQPELIDYLDNGLRELNYTPDHPSLLDSALSSVDSVEKSIDSREHADLVYAIGLTKRDYEFFIGRVVSEDKKGVKRTLYEGMRGADRLKKCSELSKSGLNFLQEDDLKTAEEQVRSLEDWCDNPRIMRSVDYDEGDGGGVVNFMSNVAYAIGGIFR